jgi:site-specific DNA-cytosine methylase
MKVCLDLCSGLGGFSQAFVDAGWKVVRIDNNPKFREVPFTEIYDICDLETFFGSLMDRYPNPTVILASPPCERFSIANRMFPKVGIRKALEIVGSVFEIIATLRPKYWIVENPKGRLRWFLGTPNSSIHLSDYGSKYLKPTDLWHNLTFKLIEAERPYEPSWSSTKNNMKGSTGLLRLHDPAKRALIPYGLSKAVLEAVT